MPHTLKQRWLNSLPFAHLILENILTKELCSDLIALLERVVWKESQESFFKIQRMSYGADVETVSNLLRDVAEPSIKAELENALCVDLPIPAGFGFQKYVPGTGIGSHTDSEANAARFVLNLNRGWTPEDGGIWLLSDNYQLRPQPKFIVPKNNSGFGFVPGKNTYHALSERNSSEAYAIIFEFLLCR
jgi:hypothetical protein